MSLLNTTDKMAFEEKQPKRKRIDSFLSEIKELVTALTNIVLRKNAVILIPKHLFEWPDENFKEFLKTLRSYGYNPELNKELKTYYTFPIRLGFELKVNERIYGAGNKAYIVCSKKKDIFNNQIRYYISETYISKGKVNIYG